MTDVHYTVLINHKPAEPYNDDNIHRLGPAFLLSFRS